MKTNKSINHRDVAPHLDHQKGLVHFIEGRQRRRRNAGDASPLWFNGVSTNALNSFATPAVDAFARLETRFGSVSCTNALNSHFGSGVDDDHEVVGLHFTGRFYLPYVAFHSSCVALHLCTLARSTFVFELFFGPPFDIFLHIRVNEPVQSQAQLFFECNISNPALCTGSTQTSGLSQLWTRERAIGLQKGMNAKQWLTYWRKTGNSMHADISDVSYSTSKTDQDHQG